MRSMASLIAALPLLAFAAAARAQDEEKVLRAFEERYRAAADKAAAVTVSLRVDRVKDATPPPAPRGPRGLGGADPFSKRPEHSPVTGVIIDADGWIATSHFNVAGELKEIEATLPDGRVLPAKLVGYQSGADIALLKVEATGLPVLTKVEEPELLKTGHPVVAVGRGPDGRGLTVNPGIMSAPGRHAGKTIQVDCRLNFGNVGGPLVDFEGRLIGMTCKVSSARTDLGQNSGVGFALLATHIDKVLPALKKGEKTTSGTGRPFLGVGPPRRGESPDAGGAEIEEVISGGSAEKAGIKNGDIITSIDGVKVKNFDELRTAIMKKKVGETAKLKVKRDDEELEIDVVLGERAGE